MFILFSLSACADAERPLYKPQYTANRPSGSTQFIFAPHPLMTPQKLAEVYGALVDQLNQRLARDRITLKLEASSSYAAFNEKLRGRKVHFALPNPYQTVLAQDYGYKIFGKADRDEDFRGIILARRDFPLVSPLGLKGATVAFPAPTALAATMMPELFLKENGLDPRSDIIQLFTGTHDSALISACLGSAAAVCTWPRAWDMFQKEHPQEARLLAVRWRTASLPDNGLIALNSVPEHVRSKVAQAFFQLHESPEGRRIALLSGTPRYIPADNATYAPVHAFIARYNASVRPLKGLDE
ncbi:MAG TPA: PhnD/SsuA/transferrin family substrate-binding protein [Humidesulfovibrio sp.]|uniref:phosphate/phosphite/phosphonate ABC transporter substrate-binding protein n=1 Tax=Humidesulfovibrio sp. TaxID=2910988 RepID=UPI002C8B9146|nr:PhnD/SsuA/transferrin family substrate-binding protein [Humidesulfovibrio sp.]HWR02820.1 PhnD/SsuA/transferrin family substrate-binding protein [Humidesulfovibrio sp.]